MLHFWYLALCEAIGYMVHPYSIGVTISGWAVALLRSHLKGDAVKTEAKKIFDGTWPVVLVWAIFFVGRLIFVAPAVLHGDAQNSIAIEKTESRKMAIGLTQKDDLLTSSTQRIAALETDNQRLRDQLADTRAEASKARGGVPSTPPPLPSVEGVTLTPPKAIPSPVKESPYAIEFTVQVQESISPFGMGFIFEKPIDGGYVGGTQPGAYSVSDGRGKQFPDRSFWGRISSPAIGPQNSMVVKIWAKEPIVLQEAVRLQ